MANNYAIIENGKVVNLVVAESSYATQQGWVSCPEGAGIGWSYINGVFEDKRPKPEVVAEPAPTKEQLLAELQALTAKINALG